MEADNAGSNKLSDTLNAAAYEGDDRRQRRDDSLFESMQNLPLTARFWTVYGLIVASIGFEALDLWVVSFLISSVAKEWHLTFLETATILLSAGVGTIVGALTLGRLADALGRKPTMVAGGLLCSLSAGAIALVPNHGWLWFSALRFLVGVGYAGAFAGQYAMIIEMTPSRHRALLSSLAAVPVSAGVLFASSISSLLLSRIGWRGMCALCTFSATTYLAYWVIGPESPHWCLVKGQVERSREILATLFKLPLSMIVFPAGAISTPSPVKTGDLIRFPRQFWLIVIAYSTFATAINGVVLWGPTGVAMMLGTTAQKTAGLFVFVGCAGLIGRIFFSMLPLWLGRRRSAEIICYGAALCIAGAAISRGEQVGAIPLLLAFIVFAAFFYDGGFANLAPYSAELYPVQMRARAAGLGHASSGVGKIAGPLVLALVAGANNIVSPTSTRDALLPGFLFLAGCAAISGLTFTLLGIETYSRRRRHRIEPGSGTRLYGVVDGSEEDVHKQTPQFRKG